MVLLIKAGPETQQQATQISALTAESPQQQQELLQRLEESRRSTLATGTATTTNTPSVSRNSTSIAHHRGPELIHFLQHTNEKAYYFDASKNRSYHRRKHIRCKVCCVHSAFVCAGCPLDSEGKPTYICGTTSGRKCLQIHLNSL